MDGHGNNGKVIKENTEQTFQWRAATAAIAAAAAAKAASSGDGQSKTDHSKDNKTGALLFNFKLLFECNRKYSF